MKNNTIKILHNLNNKKEIRIGNYLVDGFCPKTKTVYEFNGYYYHYCICLFGVLRRFQRCTGHITTGSWKGRGNQYIQFARVLYCKLPTNGKQLPAFPLTTMTGIKPRPQSVTIVDLIVIL